MSTNLYRALRELLPESPLQVATVVQILSFEGASLVQWPGAGQQQVRGTSVAVGANAFVRNGVIEGAAPALDSVVIEV